MNIADALSGRAGLAGVQWALLAPPSRSILRRALATLLPDEAMLGPCRLHRAKFKPGRKLTAYYDVTIRDNTNGGPKVRPIAVTWQPDAAVELGPALDLMAMEDDARRHGLAAPFQKLVAVLPSWGMRVQVSPLDTRFPQLVRVSDSAHVRAMLAIADSALAPATRYAITPIRYRPGQRHVLRYEPLDSGRAGDTVFAKLYESDNGARAFRVASSVADWLTVGGQGVTAVRPLAYLADDAVILYPRVTGTPFSHRLRRPSQAVGQQLRTIGSALQALHHAPEGLAGTLKLNSFESEVKAIAQAAEHVHPLLPSAGAAITTLLDRARELHAQMAQESPTFAHGDLKADHLWVTPAGLTLIDFDTCYLADPAIDVGKFLADLQWWYAAYVQPGVERAQELFLESYAPGAPAERLLRARLYEALILVKMTVRRVRLFDADWAQRTENLIARADALLQNLEATWARPIG